ncbi:hypothetical protein [Thiomicrorhabdus sp.]|uniref:lipase family protein n=1 Tax=Thiomicrorhabdus sp. TaxID=2039724 RepID=UPI0029C7EF2C|nr:hypothetical protein [Thiomicrorhabdus sp.]
MEYFTDLPNLKSLPIKRSAYSDRIAWILAEFSRLVYEELPQEKDVQELIKDIQKLAQSDAFSNKLQTRVTALLDRSGRSESQVESILKSHSITFLDSFVKGDTEALLAEVSSGHDQFLVLAFRGTSSPKDAFTDARAMLQPAIGGGRAHQGFHDGIHIILEDIRASLLRHGGDSEKVLYITGHSLGGAWAMLATKYLQSCNIGATYTFGCPRVADDEFYSALRTPVYRVVHRADMVTRLPFGYGVRFFLNTIRLIPINGTKRLSEWLRRKIVGYTHYGDLIYIHGELPGEEQKDTIRVKHSPNIFILLEDLCKQISNSFTNFAKDHFMVNYSNKLKHWAKLRQKQLDEQ